MSRSQDLVNAMLAAIDAATEQALQPYRMVPFERAGAVKGNHVTLVPLAGQRHPVFTLCRSLAADPRRAHRPVRLSHVDCLGCLDELALQLRPDPAVALMLRLETA